ncbi:hypothetical protein KB206_04480 [Microvirga sp. STS02]|uniref:hypothetical protein n=1 Tax=Hymenobacter negativus TaxID=2795026 RepID=UPI0018DE5CBB|nr:MULTISPECIES: hypothetical protein [Bacteria]MBH8568126.1 hypothetical protein [Hymenobacter negativus]MBR7207861.1 hypothetical protein [Microvirga sp. STS02]
MLKRNWHYLLLLFLIGDLAYSGWQYFQFPLDGDLAPIVAPGKAYSTVLHDPFGLRALLEHKLYPAPNRFFAHLFLHEYFRHVPRLLQGVLSPLDSVYAACALLKLAVHMLLVYVLAVAISNSRKVLGRKFLLAAVLITPLLQAEGYGGQMGVIDWSVTYTAFYALPMSLLLLFFLPFLRAALHGTPLRLSALEYAGLLGLAVVLALNGPIIPAVVLLVCPTALLLAWRGHFAGLANGMSWFRRATVAIGALPWRKLSLFVLFSALSLYSLYIGRYNSENEWASISLPERYARLPLGVYDALSGKLGLPLLLVMLLVNAWLIARSVRTPLGAKAQQALQWLGVFALVYMLLLPLGGYRAYRENVVRRDSILPILLGMIGCFAFSSYYLLTHLPAIARRRYAAAVAVFAAIFTIADKPKARDFNTCERQLFATLAQSAEPVVLLPSDCTIMDWNVLTDYRKSDVNTEMMYFWGIIKTPRLYYQQSLPAGN